MAFFLSPEVLLRGLGSICDLQQADFQWAVETSTVLVLFFLLFNSVEKKPKTLWGTLIKGRIRGVGSDSLMPLVAYSML